MDLIMMVEFPFFTFVLKWVFGQRITQEYFTYKKRTVGLWVMGLDTARKKSTGPKARANYATLMAES